MPKAVQIVSHHNSLCTCTGCTCTHAFYFRLEAFDEAVGTLMGAYKCLAVAAQDQGILSSFEKIWTNGRKSLALKLARTYL